MPWYDLPEEQLKDYRTETREPADLDSWWRQRLDQLFPFTGHEVPAAHVERQLRHLREFLG